MRLRFGDFFSRMWLEKACLARTLPEPVTLKRFFAPLWVFILGIEIEDRGSRPSDLRSPAPPSKR